MLFLWFVIILTVKKKWLSVYNMIVSIFLSLSYFLLDIFATGKHFNHRDKYVQETATNLQSLHFHEPEKAIKLVKKYNNKDQTNLKRNCKTFSKVKCIQISCKKCLILNVFITESSVQGGNMSWDREVSIIKCPLHKGFVMRVWASFHLFLRKVSVVERCPL